LPGLSPIAEATSPAEHGRAPSADEVLDVVRELLVEVIGPEYVVGLSIDMDTAFDLDLQMESLEFVVLAERLPDLFGPQVDFVSWLAGMELEEIIALTVGDLVTFVAGSLAGSASVSAAAGARAWAALGPG
jgi:acyl carrier protein